MQRLVFVFANLILLCSCARIVRQVKGNVESQVRFGVVWFGSAWFGMVWDCLGWFGSTKSSTHFRFVVVAKTVGPCATTT